MDYLVSMGVYGVSKRVLSMVPADRPYGFDDLMRDLLATGERVAIHAHDGYWADIGRPEDYMQAIDAFEGLKAEAARGWVTRSSSPARPASSAGTWCRRSKRLGTRVKAHSRRHGDISSRPPDVDDVRHVFHLAARTFVPDSWSVPASFYEVNVVGTVNVLELCRRTGASLTFLSSYVYGPPRALPDFRVASARRVQPIQPHEDPRRGDRSLLHGDVRRTSVRSSGPSTSTAPRRPTTSSFPRSSRQVLDPAIDAITVAICGRGATTSTSQTSCPCCLRRSMPAQAASTMPAAASREACSGSSTRLASLPGSASPSDRQGSRAPTRSWMLSLMLRGPAGTSTGGRARACTKAWPAPLRGCRRNWQPRDEDHRHRAAGLQRRGGPARVSHATDATCSTRCRPVIDSG